MKKLKLKTIIGLNEISAARGLTDIITGATSRIECTKMSIKLATQLQDWLRLSPYGKKYNSYISKTNLPTFIKTASMWGVQRYLDSSTKTEYAVISKLLYQV